MSANLSKETAAHSERWHRWNIGDESEKPMRWDDFADGLERQRDNARNVAEQYISKANAYDAEILGYRETIKALEERCSTNDNLRQLLGRKNSEIADLAKKLAQVEEQLASKDGYPAQPVDDGGPAIPFNELDQRTGGVFAQHSGMTLRDWLAGMAMQGLVSNPDTADSNAEIAKFSFAISNAMLAVRNGKGVA